MTKMEVIIRTSKPPAGFGRARVETSCNRTLVYPRGGYSFAAPQHLVLKFTIPSMLCHVLFLKRCLINGRCYCWTAEPQWINSDPWCCSLGPRLRLVLICSANGYPSSQRARYCTSANSVLFISIWSPSLAHFAVVKICLIPKRD
jgi:hypothetical protein